MRFDLFTIGLLMLRPDAPRLDDAAAAALQDAHMAYRADLHEAGDLLATGPLADERFRGLSVWAVGPERAQELGERDPSVLAGRLATSAVRWMVPGDTVRFSPTRLPRSVAEVAAGEVGLDRFTVVLLRLRPDAPAMDDEARSALQDAHLAYNAERHEAGDMLAAGPLRDEELRSLSIWGGEPELVRERAAADPTVRTGRLAPLVLPWMVPSGAIAFSAGRFPRSRTEAAYE